MRRNRYAHIVFGLVVVAIAVYVFTWERSDPEETGDTAAAASTTNPVETTGPAETPTTTVPATIGTTTATTTGTTAATAPTSTTSTSEVPAFQAVSATDYVEGMVGFKATLTRLVSDLTAANRAWDDRAETGVEYQQTEEAIERVLDGTRALAEAVRDHPAPPDLEVRHHGSQGPVPIAGELVTLAEAVLDGLRAPRPDDGSTRRGALADYAAAAETFGASIDELIRYVEEGPETEDDPADSEPTAPATVAPTTTQAIIELSDEAVAYIDGLNGFKQTLASLVAETNAASEAWDLTEETGATYRETAAAFRRTIEQARSFNTRVRDHPIPEPVGPVGGAPIGHAARLPGLAEAILEGLRIPAPEDGSVRRAALAEFNTAAENFGTSVDNLISYIDENAARLGLVKTG